MKTRTRACCVGGIAAIVCLAILSAVFASTGGASPRDLAPDELWLIRGGDFQRDRCCSLNNNCYSATSITCGDLKSATACFDVPKPLRVAESNTNPFHCTDQSPKVFDGNCRTPLDAVLCLTEYQCSWNWAKHRCIETLVAEYSNPSDCTHSAWNCKK
jgi:hypothetical protein